MKETRWHFIKDENYAKKYKPDVAECALNGTHIAGWNGILTWYKVRLITNKQETV